MMHIRLWYACMCACFASNLLTCTCIFCACIHRLCLCALFSTVPLFLSIFKFCMLVCLGACVSFVRLFCVWVMCWPREPKYCHARRQNSQEICLNHIAAHFFSLSTYCTSLLFILFVFCLAVKVLVAVDGSANSISALEVCGYHFDIGF